MTELEPGTIIHGTMRCTDLAIALAEVLRELDPNNPALDCAENIYFAQGDGAHEVLHILEEEGQDAAAEHMKQWHMGNHELIRIDGHGSADDIWDDGNYMASFNPGMGYAGLVYVDHEAIESLCDALEEYAPADHYVGAHPGDGSDYGVWPIE